MQACKAYYRNGQFVPVEALEIPEGSEAIVTVLDTAQSGMSQIPEENAHAKTWRKFLEEIKACDEPLGEEFDKAMSERVNFTRAIDL